jgi:hypothetical protein
MKSWRDFLIFVRGEDFITMVAAKMRIAATDFQGIDTNPRLC